MVKEGAAEFYTPLSSHETMVVQIPPNTTDDLFVHHFQTDQLFVVRGSFVLVVLQNRHYQYIALSEHQPTVVNIPPGIPYGSINASPESCVLLNAVIRHGSVHERYYRPIKRLFPYDMAAVQALETEIGYVRSA